MGVVEVGGRVFTLGDAETNRMTTFRHCSEDIGTEGEILLTHISPDDFEMYLTWTRKMLVARTPYILLQLPIEKLGVFCAIADFSNHVHFREIMNIYLCKLIKNL